MKVVKHLEDGDGEDKKEKEGKVENVLEEKVEDPNFVDEEYLVKYKGREMKDTFEGEEDEEREARKDETGFQRCSFLLN